MGFGLGSRQKCHPRIITNPFYWKGFTQIMKFFIISRRDLPATGFFNPNEVHAIFSSHGIMALIPLKNYYRIIFDVFKMIPFEKIHLLDI